MEDFIGTAASAATGGIFGLFGTALGRVAGFFERRQKNRHEEKRWAHEGTLINLEMQAKSEASAQALREIAEQGSWSGLTASLEAEAAIGESYKWVNAARALTRPLLTLLLWLITVSIWMGADAPGREAITDTATFAATAATLWWFGDRGAKGPGGTGAGG